MAVGLIYVRRSMVRYEADRASPERQLANCVRVCEEKGWTYEVYQDAEGHRSGRSEKHRPEWRDLKTQLGRPEVAAVVVSSLDRASRSPRDFFVFLDLLQTHDVELISVHERFDTTTAIGKAFLAMLMVVASLESDLASERVSDSVEHRRRRGVHVGIAPYGYDREGGRLVVNEDAPVVRLMMDLYSGGEYSYREVAAELNRRGFRFRDRYGGKRFSKVSVRSVLQNAWLYAGRLPVGRERERGYGEMHDGVHEALISTALAERVVSMRDKRMLGTTRGASRVYPLTGVLYCYECGNRMWGRRRGKRGVSTYRHSGRACRPRGGTFQAEAVEEAVLSLLDGLALPKELEEGVRERVRERVEAEPSNSEVAERLKAERAKLQRLKEMRLEGEIDREEYLGRKAEITAVVVDLEARLGVGGYDAELALVRISDVGQVVRQGTPAQQRRVLHSVFERVEVSVESREIERVVPRPWFGLFFRDLAEVMDGERAWRGLGAGSVRRLAGLIA